jgi:HEAT repeat protein
MSTPTIDPLEQLPASHLVEMLRSKEFTRTQAATAVLFRRGAAALDALVEGLSHPDWRVRKNCAALMDHLGDDRCVEPLRRALTDPIEGVRRLAIHALGCQPCKAAPLAVDLVALLIERSLSDPSVRVRRVAVHMLGLQPYDPRAVEVLETLLAQEADPRLRSRAQFALNEQRKKAAEAKGMSCSVPRGAENRCAEAPASLSPSPPVCSPPRQNPC